MDFCDRKPDVLKGKRNSTCSSPCLGGSLLLTEPTGARISHHAFQCSWKGGSARLLGCVLASWASGKASFSTFPEDQARSGTQEMDLSAEQSSEPREVLWLQLAGLRKPRAGEEQGNLWKVLGSFLLRPFPLGGPTIISPLDCSHPNQLPSKGAGQFCGDKMYFHPA